MDARSVKCLLNVCQTLIFMLLLFCYFAHARTNPWDGLGLWEIECVTLKCVTSLAKNISSTQILFIQITISSLVHGVFNSLHLCKNSNWNKRQQQNSWKESEASTAESSTHFSIVVVSSLILSFALNIKYNNRLFMMFYHFASEFYSQSSFNNLLFTNAVKKRNTEKRNNYNCINV